MITAMFYLYYEQRYATRALGPFVLLVIAAAVGFLLWYTVSRDAADIQPLVPALQSWWMKIHVPANFIGYGTFALSAMVACAYLLKSHGIWSTACLRWKCWTTSCTRPFPSALPSLRSRPSWAPCGPPKPGAATGPGTRRKPGR